MRAQAAATRAILAGLAIASVWIVIRVSEAGRAYVLAGPGAAGLLAEVLLATIAFGTATLAVRSSRRAVLLVGAAAVFLLEELASPVAPSAGVFALGIAATGTAWGCVALALRPERAALGRLATAAITTGAAAGGPLAAAFWQPDRHGCWGCPHNALAVTDAVGWSSALARWGAVAVLFGALAMTLASLSRARSRKLDEMVAALGLLIGAGVSLVPRIEAGVSGIPQPPSRLIAAGALAAVTVALAVPDLQHLRRRAAIRRLATRVAAAPGPGELAAEVARVMGDPTLDIAFGTANGALVDRNGEQLPPNWTEGRSLTQISRDGRDLAIVSHADGCFDDERDVASLTRMAGLAIEHERARAEQKAQSNELRASRRRLVEASDRERRRLEHDLHDGAQQRLVSLLLTMRRASVPPAVAAALAAAERHLQAAIAELRMLTHGLLPPILESDGLAAALEDLELSSTTIVEILELPSRRASPLIESTAYLAAALAVADGDGDGESTVQLRVRCTHDALVVDARGTRLLDSSQWRALGERVTALDGQLLRSPDQMTVTLPCVS